VVDIDSCTHNKYHIMYLMSQANLERLKDLFFSNGECPDLVFDTSKMKKKRKTKRDTWYDLNTCVHYSVLMSELGALARFMKSTIL
jgi:hypothetical protein